MLLLFTYGTLRRDCTSGAHQQYLQHAHFIGTATLQAQLFRVSFYPAVVLSDQNHQVYGEVYALQNIQQLERIDAYEECAFPPMIEQEYRRELVRVTMDSDDSDLLVWAYIYNRTTENLERIPSGNFLTP